MVKLNKIYTRTGDDGSTGLGDGERVPKTDLRVDAYGTVDEANSTIGLCVVECGEDDPIRALLESVQQDLFDLGADLCCPIKPDQDQTQMLRVTADQTARLEGEIDRYNADLAALTSFLLPGGTRLAAALHLARTVVRRAERLVVELYEAERERTSAEPVRYLNRLSDLLFVLARVANAPERGGSGDVLWQPGANRS